MFRTISLTCVAVAALGLVGCGGADDTTSVTTGDMAMPVFKVISGPYTVSGVMKVSDACGLTLEDPATGFTSIQVTNDGNGHLSLGTMCMTTGNPPTCSPAVYSNGTGMFSGTDPYHVTTMATTTVTADSQGTCKYDRTRTNVITVTADNKLQIDFTEDQSNVTAGCAFTYTTCTSEYKYAAGM